MYEYLFKKIIFTVMSNQVSAFKLNLAMPLLPPHGRQQKLPTTKVIRDNKLKVRNIPLSIFTLIF
jgi:hypothetical protein